MGTHGTMVKNKYFWLSVLAGGFFLALTLWFNLTMDQSIYCYGAWVWKHYHLPPYIGVWDQNFPGIFIIHRVALELFGESVLGFRLFDFAAQLGGLAMIYHLAKTLSGLRGAGFLACVGYGIFYYGLGSMHTGQREGFIFLLLLLAVVIGFAFNQRAWRRAMLTGLLLGFAFLVKPQYGLCWPVFGVWFFGECYRKSPRQAFLQLFGFGFFCLVPSLLIVLYYGQAGQLRELYRATLWYNFAVYSAWPALQAGKGALLIQQVREIFEGKLFIFICGAAGAYLSLRAAKIPEQKKLFKVLMALAVTGLLAYLAQGKFIAYQLIPFWGVVIVFAGVGGALTASRLRGLSRGPRGRLLGAVFYPVLVALLIATSLERSLIRFAYQDCFRSFEMAYINVRGTPLEGNGNASFYLAARYLSRYIEPEDQLEVFGPYPLAPFLLKRKLPSRFCCVQHLIFIPRDGRMRPIQEQWLREYESAVISARPRYFLVAAPIPDNPFFNLRTRSLKQALKEYFPRLEAYFADNYRLLMEIGGVEIYERVPPRQ